MTNQHQPVLLQEVVEALAIKTDGIYVDATYGRGGHTQAILQCLGPHGKLFVFDKDPEAIAAAKIFAQQQGQDERFCIQQGTFAMLTKYLKNYIGQVNGIVFDLGVSSTQLDKPERGFSFLRDGPLDMRMNSEVGMDAASWLNSVSQRELEQVLHQYGEERFARRIAAAIVRERAHKPILRTVQLANIVAQAHPAWEKHKHPATRSFQAIRIFINRELEDLQQGLEQTIQLLAKGGRLAVISFHSLEDRIVKRFIYQHAKEDPYPPGLPILQTEIKHELRIVGKPKRPSAPEIATNPRSRSAILRIAEKLIGKLL